MSTLPQRRTLAYSTLVIAASLVAVPTPARNSRSSTSTWAWPTVC